MSAFLQSGRFHVRKITKIKVRFRPKGDITRAAFELGLVLNPVSLVNRWTIISKEHQGRHEDRNSWSNG